MAQNDSPKIVSVKESDKIVLFSRTYIYISCIYSSSASVHVTPAIIKVSKGAKIRNRYNQVSYVYSFPALLLINHVLIIKT